MSILNVNQIQPVGSGQTITISASDITASSATITASKITASSGDFTVGTGSSVYSPATNTLALGTNSAERVRITSDGKVSIGGFNPAVAGLSISNSSTNRGLEFDTGSGFDSTSCIRAYDRPTTAYKSLGLTGSDIKFGINDVKKVSITSGGNVEIANGNLVFSTSGTGIDFSATSDATGMSSELLDDYEEGTWTPTLSPVTGAFTSVTYQVRSGTYTKIGNTVFLRCNFYTNGITVGTASGNVNISGLPFVNHNLSGMALHDVRLWSKNPSSCGTVSGNLVALYKRTAYDANEGNITVGDLQTSGVGNLCQFSGVYDIT